MYHAQSNNPITYAAQLSRPLPIPDEEILRRAADILLARATKDVVSLDSPTSVREYLRITLHDLEYEAFGCVWLNAQHHVICFEQLARGTLTQTSVYPREIVKAALKHNAHAVIFYHNHPSGVPEPSDADKLLTQHLKSALALVDTMVLDHFIITAGPAYSFAERGLI